MPKKVEVPGLGVVEFPDDMSDEAISGALRKQTGAAAPPEDIRPRHPYAIFADKVKDFLGGTQERGGVKGAFLPADFQASDVVTGPAQAAAHPIESAKLLLGAAQEGSEQQLTKGILASRAGKPTEAVTRTAAGLLPFAGPSAAEAGDLIKEGVEEGDEHKIAAGLGLATGLLAPFLKRGGKKAPAGAPEAAGTAKTPPPAPEPLPVQAEAIPPISGEAPGPVKVPYSGVERRAKGRPSPDLAYTGGPVEVYRGGGGPILSFMPFEESGIKVAGKPGKIGPYEHLSDSELIQETAKGTKPASLIEGPSTHPDIEAARQQALDAGLSVKEQVIHPEHPDYVQLIVGKDKAAVDRLSKAARGLSEAGPDATAEHHAEMGRSLGYSEADIAEFLKQNSDEGGVGKPPEPPAPAEPAPDAVEEAARARGFGPEAEADIREAANGKKASSAAVTDAGIPAAVDLAHSLGLKTTVVRGDKGSSGYRNTLYVAKNAADLQELVAAYKSTTDSGFTPEAHRRLGRAYGFSESDIDAFISRAGSGGVEHPAAEKPLPTVPLTRGERTGSRAYLAIEHAVEGSYPGAPIFDKFRKAQQKALIDKQAAAVVDRISKLPESPESGGRAVQEAIKQAQSGLRAQASAKYVAIDEAAQGIKVPTAQLKAFAKEIKGELTAVSGKKGLLPADEFTRTVAILNKIKAAPAQVPFAVMQAFRSNLLGKIRDLGVEIPDRAAGVIKKFSSIADQSMESAAKTGNPDLIVKIKEANALWRETTETFNDSVVSRMAEAAPEKLHNLIKGASLEDIRRVRKTLPADKWQEVKARVLEDAFGDAVKGGVSEALPGHGQTPTMRGTSLRSVLENRNLFGDERLKAIFEPQELSNINKVLETAERISPQARAGGIGTFVNIINAAMIYPVARAGKGLLTGDLTAAAKPVGIYAGTRAVARLMTSPAGSSALYRFTKALVDAGIKLDGKTPPAARNPAVRVYASQVMAALARTPEDETGKAGAAR